MPGVHAEQVRQRLWDGQYVHLRREGKTILFGTADRRWLEEIEVGIRPSSYPRDRGKLRDRIEADTLAADPPETFADYLEQVAGWAGEES
jgi:hypothetical protein